MLVNSKHNIRKSTYNCAQDSPLIRTSSPTQVGVRLVVPLRKSSWEMQIAVLPHALLAPSFLQESFWPAEVGSRCTSLECAQIC